MCIRDRGDKVWHICYGLDNFFELHGFYFVQQQRKKNRGCETEAQSPYVQHEGIFYSTEEIGTGQEFTEMLQSHPFAAGKPQKRLIVLKGNQNSPHGSVAEYEIPDKDRKD